MKSALFSCSDDFWNDSTCSLFPCMTELQCCLVVRLGLSLVIELCAGFENWLQKPKKKRSLQCSDMIYMKQETIAFQDWSKRRKVQEVSAEVVAQRWEVQGENCRNADSVSSLPRVLSGSGDDTAPC